MFSDMNKVTQKIPTARDPRPKQTDTREDIRRHDPDHERRKGANKEFVKKQGLFGEDQTEVSVESLETFLPMLLKNFSAKDRFADRANVSEKVDKATPNAKAAGAYARMAQYSPVQSLKEKVVVKEDVSEEKANPSLSNTEIQAIHKLQEDVKALKLKGVQSIYIKKAGTFLESLQDAVRQAL